MEVIDSEFKNVPCIYKPSSKKQRRKIKHSQKKSNEKYIKSPRTTEKDENTSSEEILKPTEINGVNNGERKMINECDHECPKAVGFSYPGVVLDWPEWESEENKRK